jgi:diaminohydroxyphosphoribosylaminopyrimidine deaminase/5-amino-6-(5-phosphoribosylamino)uracil reductase
MVGANTAIVDNPQLTVRYWRGKNPIRIIIGSRELPEHLQINNSDAQTYRYHTVSDALNDLYEKEILSVMVEGGAKLLQSFIDEGLWDEARVFIGNKFSGEGVKTPVLKDFKVRSQEKIEDDDMFIITRLRG